MEFPNLVLSESETIERIHVEGPMEASMETLDILIQNGYNIIRSGPKVEELRANVNRFYILAERSKS
jgi:hypothetical protein